MKEQDKDRLLSQMKFPLHINKDGYLIDADGTNADNKFTKEEAELFVEISLDAVNKIYTPKPHISQLANSKEDCREVARLLGWEGIIFSAEWIERHAKPKVCFWNKELSKQFNINADGEMALFDPAANQDDTLKFEPIPNCIQIIAFILSKYSL